MSIINRRQVMAAFGGAVSLLGSRFASHAQATPPLATSRELNIRLGTRRIAPAPADETPMIAASDISPLPVLRAIRGEALTLNMRNGIDRPLLLHAYGLRGTNSADGVAGLTGKALEPGEDRAVQLTPPDAGTFIYRPRVPGHSAWLGAHGLKGLMIAEDPASSAQHEEITLAIDDIRLDEAGRHAPFDPADVRGPGRLGNHLLVNGLPAPLEREAAPGERMRLRIANLANARAVRMRFDGMKAWVLAVDSQPVDIFEPLGASLPIAPGGRYDVLVEAPPSARANAQLVAVVGTSALALMSLTNRDEAPRTYDAPPQPLPANAALPAQIRLEKAARAEIVVTGGARRAADGTFSFEGDPARPWLIGGQTQADPFTGRPLVSARRGTPVVLSIINRTPWAQPFHIHGHAARLLHPLDDGWEPYWLDTVTALPEKTIRIAFVADNPGRWLVGSSVLERFDAGLAAFFEVT